MPLRPNATLQFTGYTMEEAGARLNFLALDPGAGEPNNYQILLTIAELATVTTQAALRTLVMDKLNTLLRALGVAAKLDPFIGQSLVI